MKIKNIIELYDWDKEFDYEELAKLKENLQLLIHTGIKEFLEKIYLQAIVEEPEDVLEYLEQVETELEEE